MDASLPVPRMSTSLAPSTARKPWQVIAAGICALVLTVGLARFAYTPLLPLMRVDAGLSAAQGGWLATFNYLGYLLGTLLAARVGDMQQKFRFYRIGLVLAVAATNPDGDTTQPWLWSLLRFVAGHVQHRRPAAGLRAGAELAAGQPATPAPGPALRGAGPGHRGLRAGHRPARRARRLQRAMALAGPAGPALPGSRLVLDAGTHPDLRRTGRTSAAPPSRRWRQLLVAAYFCAGVGFVVSATFIVAILEQTPPSGATAARCGCWWGWRRCRPRSPGTASPRASA